MKRLALAAFLLCVGVAHADTFSSFTTRINSESSKFSYRVQVADVTVAATATDVMTLCGSATRTVRVHYVRATADATDSSVIDFYLYKRTVLNTGGTSAAPPIATHDSRNPTPTASVKLYSANPSALGTGVLFLGDRYALPSHGSTVYPIEPWVGEFGVRNDQTLVLRGVAECAAFSLGGQTIPAGFMLYIHMGWTEE